MSSPLPQPNPSSCCNFLSPLQKVYQSKPTINEEDRISNAPGDCIIAIFQFLNHADLDVMSCVNQKMGAFAACARPQARRRLAEQLFITQSSHNDDIEVEMIVGGWCWRMVHGPDEHSHFERCRDYGTHRPALFRNEFETDEERPRQALRTIPCCVYERLHYLSERFDFGHIIFTSILIDDRFLTHCKKIFRPNLEGKMGNRKMDFDDSFTMEDRKRFIDWVISMKPRELDFDVNLEFYGFPELECMKILSRNENCTDFSINSLRGARKTSNLCILPVTMFNEITRFKEFWCPKIVIEAGQVMNFVLRRVEKKKYGYYLVRTTRVIKRTEIMARLEVGDDEFEVKRIKGMMKISFPRLKYAVTIDQDNEDFTNGLKMTFFKH